MQAEQHFVCSVHHERVALELLQPRQRVFAPARLRRGLRRGRARAPGARVQLMEQLRVFPGKAQHELLARAAHDVLHEEVRARRDGRRGDGDAALGVGGDDGGGRGAPQEVREGRAGREEDRGGCGWGRGSARGLWGVHWGYGGASGRAEGSLGERRARVKKKRAHVSAGRALSANGRQKSVSGR